MDRPQPVTLASPHSDGPLPEGTVKLGGSEASQLIEQVKLGNLVGLRDYLARSRKEGDWQDRIFMLSIVVRSVRLAALDFACGVEPQAADLLLIRCAYFSDLALTMRGTGTCDQVAEGSWNQAAICIKAALGALEKAASIDTQDPTAHAFVLRPLNIFGSLMPLLNGAFQQAVRLAPGLVPAHYAIVTALSERWHGSHEQSLQFARSAVGRADPASDMAVCLFWAHLLVRGHFSVFDKKPKAAEAYPHIASVKQELEAAFDAWTRDPYRPRRSSIPYLHVAATWFYLTEDRPRLQKALSLTDNTFSASGWGMLGNARAIYAHALLFAAGKTPPPPPGWRTDPLEKCLTFVTHGLDTMKGGKIVMAEKAFAAALVVAATAPPEQESHLTPLVLLGLTLLRRKQRQDEESRRVREKATDLLDSNDAPMPSAKFQRLMAETLYQLGEYRRALPFYEQAIEMSAAEIASVIMAGMLHRMGECLFRIGLRDHAAIPFGAALRICRSLDAGPLLPTILLNLGNSLRKSSPSEAEALYKEAAELHAARLEYQSATMAWVNLGVLYSEQGRNDEALEQYQRALRVREQTPGTPPASIAVTLNNIANCYRRMSRFPEAHALIDRSLTLLTAEDIALASVHGTRGLIFIDSGDDAQAVEWLRRARAKRMQQPSPNFDSVANDLESEIAALKRLGRNEEVSTAQETLALIRSEMHAIQKVNHDLSTVQAQIEGAVLVELTFTARTSASERHRSTSLLAERLSEKVRTQEVGTYSGHVATPGNTTLLFYGPDAEMLFKAIEPALMSERIYAGARVTIRQGSSCREIIAPNPSMTLN